MSTDLDSVRLFDRLAAGYEAHFAYPHRRAYDELAWEQVRALLPAAPATVLDAGCGVGRWAPRLVALGHRVIGIEQAPEMAAAARRCAAGLAGSFRVVEGSLEDVEMPEGGADVVLALGSLQYMRDPGTALGRFAGWLRPGGVVAVAVDSLLSIVLEHLRTGRGEEALEMLRTRRGTWREAGEEARLHLLDRAALRGLLADAGFREVAVAGLLVSTGVAGLAPFLDSLSAAPQAQLDWERRLMSCPELVDLGKHLLATGRAP